LIAASSLIAPSVVDQLAMRSGIDPRRRIQRKAARNASSPIQLSRAPASLRKPDHAAPNDAALRPSRVERIQLSLLLLHALVWWTFSTVRREEWELQTGHLWLRHPPSARLH
jgi:hypothetical protein